MGSKRSSKWRIPSWWCVEWRMYMDPVGPALSFLLLPEPRGEHNIYEFCRASCCSCCCSAPSTTQWRPYGTEGWPPRPLSTNLSIDWTTLLVDSATSTAEWAVWQLARRKAVVMRSLTSWPSVIRRATEFVCFLARINSRIVRRLGVPNPGSLWSRVLFHRAMKWHGVFAQVERILIRRRRFWDKADRSSAILFYVDINISARGACRHFCCVCNASY